MTKKALGLRKKAQAFFWISLFLTLLISNPTYAEDSLGISVSVVPDSREDGLATGNGRLWFAMEPGESYSRQLTLRSSATVNQVVSLEFRDYRYVNGVRRLSAEPSRINDWLIISPTPLEVEAGETIEVSLSVNPPADSPEQAFEGAVVLSAKSAEQQVSEDSGEKVRVEVATQIAINLDFWVGIGAAENLYPMFDIRSLEGLIGEEGSKEVRIFFENKGLIPLKLTGSAQFSSQTFEELTFGPYEFRTKDIPTGQIGFVDVEVSSELLEGPWQILVAAEQDGIKQTKLFEQDISFSSTSSWGSLWVLGAVIALGLFVALGVVGLRLIRKNPTEDSSQDAQTTGFQIQDQSLEKEERARKSKVKSEAARQQSKIPTSVIPTLKPKDERVSEFDIQLDSWADSLRNSIREVRSDSTDLVDKYKNVPTRKPRKPKSGD